MQLIYDHLVRAVPSKVPICARHQTECEMTETLKAILLVVSFGGVQDAAGGCP